MAEETMEQSPLWIPPTYQEEDSFKPSEYGLEDWRQAEEVLGHLVQMSMAFDNQALLLALWDAQDRAGIEVDRARRHALGAA
jgi:hypothetical protein